MRYRISHTHSCGFISFQNTSKFCLIFVRSTTPTILHNFTGHSRSHWCFQLLTRVLDGFLELFNHPWVLFIVWQHPLINTNYTPLSSQKIGNRSIKRAAGNNYITHGTCETINCRINSGPIRSNSPLSHRPFLTNQSRRSRMIQRPQKSLPPTHVGG